MTNLQKAKIEALGISSDFKDIFVDDPFDSNRKQKIGLFQEISKTKVPNQYWVIGDNPESELKSGKSLGMNTIQRITEEQKVSVYSYYSIRTFNELEGILKKKQHTTKSKLY